MVDSIIQAETIDLGNNSPRNILSWNGWHTFLEHKVKQDPNDAFNHLTLVINQLRIGIPAPLQRSDLPMIADPNAVMREQQFRQQGMMLMQQYAANRHAATNAMASLMINGAHNIENAAAPVGGSYWTWR
jgi:hypothetical protein